MKKYKPFENPRWNDPPVVETVEPKYRMTEKEKKEEAEKFLKFLKDNKIISKDTNPRNLADE